MKKKTWISIVVGLLIFQFLGLVFGGSFSSSVTIQNSGTKKYKGIRLTPKIINIANPYHSDLLLLNQKNEMVPYFINRTKKENFLETMMPDFTIQNEGGLTIVNFHGMKNLTLFDITIETTDMFKRFVSYKGSGKSKELYNLAFKQSQNKDLTIPLDGYQEPNDNGILTIMNQDDKPIQINKVVIRRYVEELVFDGSIAESFVLKFGNPAITEPPSYDVTSYKENIIQEGYDLLPVGEIKIEPPPPSPPLPPKPKNYKWLFNVMITSVALLIGFILLVRIKKEYK